MFKKRFSSFIEHEIQQEEKRQQQQRPYSLKLLIQKIDNTIRADVTKLFKRIAVLNCVEKKFNHSAIQHHCFQSDK